MAKVRFQVGGLNSPEGREGAAKDLAAAIRRAAGGKPGAGISGTRAWTHEEREQLARGEIKGDFAGPNQSFPIGGVPDVRAAWLLSEQAENPEAVRQKVSEIAYKFGWEDGLPSSTPGSTETQGQG